MAFRGVGKTTKTRLAACMEILEEIQPASVRAVCYVLFNRKLIPDMSKQSTGAISRLLTKAREDGDIPWEWIVDDTREIELPYTWSNANAIVKSAINTYRRDRWQNQPERVVVASEKATVAGTLRPVIHEYGLPWAVYHGFSSATAIKELANLTGESHKPLTILYVGDHDPSGRSMSDVDLPGRLAQYGGNATIERVAVTAEQIEQHGLSTFPARHKAKDTRYNWFVANHGDTCCELDALNPNQLRDTLEEAVLSHLDWEAWEQAGSTEAAEMTSLRDYFAAFPGMA